MRWIGFSILTWAVLVAQTNAYAQQVGDTYDKGSQVRIGQYSTQASRPSDSEIEPLDVFVELNFPRQSVATVGDAVNYTLMRTGWVLDKAQLGSDAVAFLALSLPESQRRIGTYRVRDVLQTLVGSSWNWKEDPVHRQLWFALVAPPSSAVSVAPAPTAPIVQPIRRAPIPSRLTQQVVKP
ncbi:hypothetical protein G7047_10705 [Diaphorobacter sp. HDW4A]|nr:hypothetical protein G7047_10705 [Diaphorobacter sp. HDW4A]